jgi:putative nucleotidyltransferase with HDIG domain
MKELISLIKENEPFISLPSGVHGKGHAERVLDFALKLSEYFEVDKKVIVIAALLHDVGRVNDYDDPEHGERGAVLAKEFIALHKIDVDASLVARCIIGHVKEANNEIECKIIGDADKLDRFRFRGHDCLRVEFLELPESHSLIGYAKKVNGV